jgi:hypothetical protein
MKKIFTLVVASFMTVALFAADRRPSVTLTADKKYEVVIDGRSYASAMATPWIFHCSTMAATPLKFTSLKMAYSANRKNWSAVQLSS